MGSAFRTRIISSAPQNLNYRFDPLLINGKLGFQFRLECVEFGNALIELVPIERVTQAKSYAALETPSETNTSVSVSKSYKGTKNLIPTTASGADDSGSRRCVTGMRTRTSCASELAKETIAIFTFTQFRLSRRMEVCASGWERILILPSASEPRTR